MKKAFITILILGFIFGINEKSAAQNLQFNKAIYLTLLGPTGADTLVVPPLSVFKLESYGVTGGNGISFDGINLAGTPTPGWYPQGTYIFTNTSTYKAFISGILFNIN